MSALVKAQVLAGLVRRKLTFFTWNVTNICNEECPMCEVIRRPAVDLTLEEATRIISEFRRAGFRSVGITGGEPFVRRDALELLDMVDRSGLVFTLATNGTLITEEIAAHVAGLKNMLQVAVSVDSLDPHRFEKLRGRPLLDEAIRGLDRLIAARPRGTVKVNFVLSRHNLDDLDSLIEFAEQRKVYLTVIPVIHGEAGMIHRRNDPMFLSAQKEREAMGAAFERLAAMRREGRLIWDSSIYHEKAAALTRGVNPGPCDAGQIMVDLRADGGFAVCPDHEPIAQLRKVSVSEAMARIPDTQEAVRRCHTETPCLYTCTYGISAIAQHPVRHLLEHRKVVASNGRP